MTANRFVIAAGLTCTVAALLGIALLQPAIADKREELDLAFHLAIDPGAEGQFAEIAFWQVALGPGSLKRSSSSLTSANCSCPTAHCCSTRP